MAAWEEGGDCDAEGAEEGQSTRQSALSLPKARVGLRSRVVLCTEPVHV